MDHIQILVIGDHLVISRQQIILKFHFIIYLFLAFLAPQILLIDTPKMLDYLFIFYFFSF